MEEERRIVVTGGGLSITRQWRHTRTFLFGCQCFLGFPLVSEALSLPLTSADSAEADPEVLDGCCNMAVTRKERRRESSADAHTIKTHCAWHSYTGHHMDEEGERRLVIQVTSGPGGGLSITRQWRHTRTFLYGCQCFLGFPLVSEAFSLPVPPTSASPAEADPEVLDGFCNMTGTHAVRTNWAWRSCTRQPLRTPQTHFGFQPRQ
jgi:hypothetical protein